VRLLREELPPAFEPEPPAPGEPFPEEPDPALYFPLLLDLPGVSVPGVPDVVVTPKGAVIAIGEQSIPSGGADQVHLYQWNKGGADEASMIHLNDGWQVPTTDGDAGKLAWIGGRPLWQIQDAFEEPTKRNIWEVVDPPGSVPPLQLFATVDGLAGDDAPLDLLDFGSGFFGVLQDPSQAGTNAFCNLRLFKPDGLSEPIESYVRCSGHESLPGRGSLFEVQDGPSNLIFLGISGGGGETTFSVEIEDTGGLKVTLPVEIEVVAP
jgi:hypothetical protein